MYSPGPGSTYNNFLQADLFILVLCFLPNEILVLNFLLKLLPFFPFKIKSPTLKSSFGFKEFESTLI